MRTEDEYERLLRIVGELPPMTPEQKRAQSICFVVGNLMIDRPGADEWELRKYAAEAWERREP